MRLLREVMEQSLDPAYARAAELRLHRPRPGRVSVVVVILLALLGGWIVARGVAELRRPQPGQAAGRAALEREIARRTTSADASQREIQQLRAQIAAAQQTQLTSQGDAALAARVQQLSLLTGELAVTGPGLEITLQDAPQTDSQGAAVDPRTAQASDQGRVLDHDLQVVVNGLWGAGAEAVAINDRRLTTLSAIRSAGEAILVDFRPILPPYRIQAIGDPTGMQAQFGSSLAAQYLQTLHDNFGVVTSITSSKGLRLPAAGAIQLSEAGVPSSPAPGSASGSTAPRSTAQPTGQPALPVAPGGSATGSSTQTEVRQ
jgi:uncharacterized protein YlxW (UPF0749 family)